MSQDDACTADGESLYTRFVRCQTFVDGVETANITHDSYKGDALKVREQLESLTVDVSRLNLFSANEHYKELNLRHLPYLLLPAYLGKMAMSVCETADRVNALEAAAVYFKDYLTRCASYELVSDVAMPWKDGDGTTTLSISCNLADGEGSDSKIISRQNVPVDAGNRRNAKIEAYKRTQQLRTSVTAHNRADIDATRDDDRFGEFYLQLLRLWAYEAVQELHSIESELPFAQMAADRASKGETGSVQPAPSTSASVRRLAPVILTRDALQKKVMGIGYPAFPTLTVDEWYTQMDKEGWFGQGKPGERPHEANHDRPPSSDEDEKDDDERVAKARAMDEYTDVTYSTPSVMSAGRSRRRSDSSSDSDGEDRLPVRSQDYSDSEDQPSASKKSRKNNIWADEQDDRRLTDAMQGRSTAMVGDDETVIDRGVESFEIPGGTKPTRYRRSEAEEAHDRDMDNVYDDNPFGPASSAELDAVETFGVPTTASKSSTSCKTSSSVHARLGKRGHDQPANRGRGGRGGRGGGGGAHRGGRGGGYMAHQSVVGAKVEHVELDADASVAMLTDQFSQILHENNKELLSRCLSTLGAVKCIALLRRVEAIESTGGMKTLDGGRRRTPGGVFLHIMRHDDIEIDKAQLDLIFVQDQQRNKKVARARRRVHRGGVAVTDDKEEQMKRDMDFLDTLNASVNTALSKPMAVIVDKKEEGEMSNSISSDDQQPSSSRCTNTPTDVRHDVEGEDEGMETGGGDPVMDLLDEEGADMPAVDGNHV